MADTVRIELKRLRFFANHGYHSEETKMGGEFEVNFFGLFPAPKSIHSLAQTIDYTEVHAVIKTIFAETEPLLETVAQKIIETLSERFPTRLHLELTITKLQPPITSFIGTVGITYARDFR